MFIIGCYDVNSKRVNKILKIFKKYLIQRQNSVFDGFLTESKLNSLKDELKNICVLNNDHVILYKFDSTSYLKIDELGSTKRSSVI